MRCLLWVPLGLIAAFVPVLAADKGDEIFEPGAKLKVESGKGSGGEGPAWHPKLGVLTSGNGGIMQLDRDGKSQAYRKEPETNGLLFDKEGRLLACEPSERRVTRTELDGKITVLADKFDGKRFNEPNDLTIDSKGRIYFSDPRYGAKAGKDQLDDKGRTIEGVYRIDPDGKITRVLGREVERANGVLVSADDKYLYVADNNNNTEGGARKLWRFDLKADGTVDAASKKLLYDWGKGRGPDGVKHDVKGRLYVAAGLNKPNPPFEPAEDVKGGIYVLSPEGKLLTFLAVPTDEVTNCAFGGDDLKALYITGGGTLYSIRTTTPGRVLFPPAARPQPPAEPAPPRLFQSDGRDLAKAKQRAAAGDKQLAEIIKDVQARAEKELKTEPLTVVNKPKAPPSGDKHDYVSMAPYFWPDPDKKDGLPYIRKDGKVNPEREKYDEPLLKKMCQSVGTLSLAYYLTGEERYAEHATKLLRVWFLDEKTRMNPNLNYAQFIPGVTDGRGIGIIDTVALLRVVDAIGMIEGSKAWTKAERAGMKEWFTDYLKWLRDSKNGKEEAAAANNHGTWYDAQVATYALFVGEDEAVVKKLLEEAKTKRIARQIEPDGKQPLELKRTKAFDYSRGNLGGLFALATLGDRLGVDLWHFETKDGRSIRKALDFLVPYAAGEKKWEYEQITTFRGGSLAPLLRRAAVAYKEESYEKLIEKLPDGGDLGTAGLFYPAPQ